MDSRKRVLRALMHNETDRVPIDMGGKQSVIHIKAYKRLLDYLDIEDKNKNFYDYAQQLAHPCNFLPEGHEPDREGKFIGHFDQFGLFWKTVEPRKQEKLFIIVP